jgi:nicotinamide mononucleotide transporter PnuC
MKLRNPFKGLTKKEWIILSCSLIIVSVSNLLAKNPSIFTVLGTLVGATALIFIARGDFFGQILCILFAILYSITSIQYKYWGEVITYLGMSAPIALVSVITWIKNPYKEDKSVVKIQKLNKRTIIIVFLLTAIVTSAFYFILKAFNTPNLITSTLSITTSFLASTLMLLRSPYYAVAYGLNDVVLIILWIMASITDLGYLPMVACFVTFLFNDTYGFISWSTREKSQAKNL